MILGTGFDLTALPRIHALLDKHGERFLARILTAREMAALPAEASRRTAYVAGRWAAKEAAVKALGSGFSAGIGFHDVEAVTLPDGAPELHFHGLALELARQKGVTRTHLSISHERDMAGAMVILEG
ncbi:MAG: holo-ACP synthase [Mailhella sp.]|nr:holo-ACP synthase [Mailhella sp.]